MTIVGIICEYNPFHRGHRKQFSEIRQRFGADAAIVCLMSGWMQRLGRFPQNCFGKVP